MRGQKKKPVISDWFSGADTQIRTGDLILTKDALYRLSYISTFSKGNGDMIHYLFGKIKGQTEEFLEKMQENFRAGEKQQKNRGIFLETTEVFAAFGA